MRFERRMLHVYLVGGTQDTDHDPDLFLHKVTSAVKAGITALQYREKGSSHLSSEEKRNVALRLRELTYAFGVPFFIDDDLELAREVHADGIHVGQKDKDIEDVVHSAKDTLIVGYSCNTVAEIGRANELDVDYIGCGPIFPTNSKADAGKALGLEKLRRLCRQSSHPMVAIGGITCENMTATLATGVDGVAVISLILASQDTRGAVRAMRAAYAH